MSIESRFVFAFLPGESEAVPAGRLELIEEGHRTVASRFAYGHRYAQRKNRIPVDPLALPLSMPAGRDVTPHGGLALFGAIRDAAPDLWGRRVIEAKLNAPADSLPESTYLDHAGPQRAGALDIRPALDAPASAGLLPDITALDHLLEAAARIEEGEPVPAHLQLIFDTGPSLGGARPKASLQHEGWLWVAKFPSRQDRYNLPLLEWAALELAREAGLRVPPTRRITLADGRDVMLIQRFDRGAGDDGFARTHMVSGLTLLGLDEMDRSGSYAQLAQALAVQGVGAHLREDRIELFRRMVFNILVNNDDDHLRNHAFLYDAAGSGWRLSPLYDVVPKPVVGSERYLAIDVGVEGRRATLTNALSHHELFGLRRREAARHVLEMVAAVRPWREVFETNGVPPTLCDAVASAFRRPREMGLAAIEREAD